LSESNRGTRRENSACDEFFHDDEGPRPTREVSHSARERRAACNEVNEKPKAVKLQARGVGAPIV
jgi:hypothetical protein